MSPYGNPPGAPQAPQTLEAFLTQRGPLAAHEVAPLLGSVMDQLATLHGSGQHHGNLSADTITVTPTPQGTMAAWLPPASPPPAGAWPSYQAPEQLVQGGQVGYWSDTYAMAAVVFRALTGQPPFTGATPEDVRLAHLQTPPPAVSAARPELAPELDRALQQGLAKAPADRQASMQAFRQDVEAAAQAAPPPAAALSPAAAPAGPDPASYAPQAAPQAAQSYTPGSVPPGFAAPPPPTMMQPVQAPKSKSGTPLVAIMVGISVLGVVASAAVVFLAGGGRDDKAASGASSPTAQQAPAEKARPTPRPVAAPAMAPPMIANPLALPGVDDKIKVAPSPAVAGGPGPHYRIDPKGQPFRGAPDAPVVLAVFSDFQCPYCKRVPPLLNDLLKKYPRDLKVVWMDFPLRFHKGAMPAAIAAYEVFLQKGNAGFWRFHDKVFADYRNISPEKLGEWAREVGADGAKVTAAVRAEKHKPRIDAAMATAKKIGVRGTPSMYINGTYYKGRRSVAGFSAVIDDGIKEAQAAVQAGKTTAKGYYAFLMKSGLTQKGAGTGANPRVGKKPRKRRVLDPKAIYHIPVFKTDPWKGARRPLVTMVIWSDFECPYCKYMACTLEEVLKKYRRTVRLVYRHNPLAFHRNAMPAAEAAEAARAIKGRKGFWRMYARLFPIKRCPRQNSRVGLRTWLRKISNEPKLTRSVLDGFARKLRLSKRRYLRYMDKHTHRGRIKAQAAAANALGARGTPALFVNGRYVRGFRDFAKLRVIIDEELKKARRLVKGGVKRSKLYDHITAHGLRKLVYLP